MRRVSIPRPGGGRRKLGIPTVLDRFVQQAVAQVLQEDWDRTFSAHSYGFRPGRSAYQAVAAAQRQMAAGRRWVVDLDLEKFLRHSNIRVPDAERTGDANIDGIFVGKAIDGPLGIIGAWDLSNQDGDNLAGAYGADLQP